MIETHDLRRDYGNTTAVSNLTLKVEPGEILGVLPSLYDRVATRPGAISRPAYFWRRYYEDAIKLGGDAHWAAVHSDPSGRDDGFVHYHVKWADASFEDSEGVGEIYDLYGRALPFVESISVRLRTNMSGQS